MNEEVKKHIEMCIDKACNPAEVYQWQTVGGGSINRAFKVTSRGHSFFVKTNAATVFENGFLEEVNGLQFLRSFDTATPNIIDHGILDDQIYLVLSWVDYHGESDDFWTNFGYQLAALHKNTDNRFGLDHMNYMGQLEQQNRFSDDFVEFFVNNRLIPQVSMAFNSGFLSSQLLKKFDNVYKNLSTIFPEEQPAAVHGDLWSGNYISSSGNSAVFIDPAVYFGHREIDLAMTTLFGGFAPRFYHSYQESYPLTPGFDARKDYYNLYPLLIHLNLFGRSYLGGITRIVSRF